MLSSRKGAALLAMLVTARDGERSRSWLQDRLWGSREAAHGQSSLRRELSNLRSLFNGHDRRDAPPLIEADHLTVRIDMSQIRVDILDLANGHRAGGAHQDGEFLEGLDIRGEELFEDWLREQRALVAARLAIGVAAPTAPTSAQRQIADKPSIAILPFANLTETPSTVYLVEGMVEEMVIALSHYSTFRVISMGTALSYRGVPGELMAIAGDYGVDYLLLGSVRDSEGRVAITVKMVAGRDGQQLWAQRFEAALVGIFDLQQRIARAVGTQIDTSIERTEMRRALAAPARSLDTYHLYWRANALFRKFDRGSLIEAIALCQQMRDIEPDNAWAAALQGFCLATVYSSGWSADPSTTRAAALDCYQEALRLTDDDPLVLGYASGILLTLGGDMTVADGLVARALELLPGSASILFWGAWVDLYLGRSESALARFEETMLLNPRSLVRPFQLTGLGLCLVALGRLDEAIAALRQAVDRLPGYALALGALAMALVLAGKAGEARAYRARLKEAGGDEAFTRMLGTDGQRAAVHATFAVLDSHADMG